ncbi:uncharacterized protein LOC144107711 [Amblyomma americanum]
MKEAAVSDPPLEMRDDGAAADPALGSAPTAGTTAPIAASLGGDATSSGMAVVDTTVGLEPDVEREEPAPSEQRRPVRTSPLSPGSENETTVVMPCNCGESSGNARPGCVHLQIYRIRVDAIRVDPGDTETQRHQNKTFLMWLMDEDHLEDHAMFVTSLLFSASLIMMLTFAWLEADLALAGISRVWAALLSLLLMVQTCTWVSFALYSLWMYPKAYIRWKTEPHVPLRRPRSASRRRHRRSRSRGSRHSSSAATQTQLVLDADQRT